MLIQNKNVANLEIINTDNYLNKHGYYEIDFFPEKKFKGEVYVFFHIVESWGNVHWYKLFREYDKKNIKVICYTSFNFLPLVRNLCHKVYLEKTPIISGFYNTKQPSRISSYGLNRHRFWHTYDIGKKGGYIEAKPHDKKWLMPDEEAQAIGQNHCSKKILIDQKEFDNFMKQKQDFGKSKVVLESKLRVNNVLRHRLQQKDNVYADHTFQRKILTKYTKFSYATYQILLSMYCGYAFVGVRGAAALLAAFPINFLIGTDLYNSNLATFSIRYHDMINQYFYNIPTGGFPHSLGPQEQIENTWREAAINFSIDDYLNRKKHYIPTKEITHFNSCNPKLNFLLDNSS